MSSLTVLALLHALAGHVPPPAVPAPLPEERVLVGKVREVAGPGDQAMAMLDPDDASGEWTLHPQDPEDRQELVRLAGTRVRLRGVVGDPRLERGRHLLVRRYQLLEVAGKEAPRLGQLASLEVGGKERLLFVGEDGVADLLPEGWGRKMKQHVGAKLWMVGERKGAAFQPLRFGILRPRREAPEAARAP
jgi:hypothetical protein